jgi:hypothetical protein
MTTQITRNRLDEREFNARRPANLPPLSPEQSRARRLFVQEHVDWSGATCFSLTNPDSVCITLIEEFECGDAQGNGI